MGLRLVVVAGQGIGSQLQLEGRPVVEIGRSTAADLTLADPAVADIHLKVFPERGVYTCFDVTGVGFLHNGQKTLKATLSTGDLLGLGGHVLRLLGDSPDEVPSVEGAGAPPGADPAAGGPSLFALKGNDAGRRYPLGHKKVVILGRGASTDITIWDIRASRAHCRIDRVASGYQLSDLNSSNGTTVNGRRITTHALRDGDLVRIGATELRFEQGLAG